MVGTLIYFSKTDKVVDSKSNASRYCKLTRVKGKKVNFLLTYYYLKDNKWDENESSKIKIVRETDSTYILTYFDFEGSVEKRFFNKKDSGFMIRGFYLAAYLEGYGDLLTRTHPWPLQGGEPMRLTFAFLLLPFSFFIRYAACGVRFEVLLKLLSLYPLQAGSFAKFAHRANFFTLGPVFCLLISYF